MQRIRIGMLMVVMAAIVLAGCAESSAEGDNNAGGDLPALGDREAGIKVKVIGENGDPLSGHQVQLRDRSGGDSQTQSTNGEGIAVFTEKVGPADGSCNEIKVSINSGDSATRCMNPGEWWRPTLQQIIGGL